THYQYFHVGVLRRYDRMAEEKYLLKHEYEEDKSKIYKRIEQDNHDTNEKISAHEKLLAVVIESQKQIQEDLRDVKGELFTSNRNMSDFKDNVNDHGRRITAIEETTPARSKHNTTIWVAVIGGIFGLLTTALGLAQFLF